MEEVFKLNLEPDWIYKDPIDFEHKKYILLAYLKKMDEYLNQNKIYPAFIDVSLQLASLQTIIKENIILSTNKKFISFDDEVLLKELIAKPAPKLSTEESYEVEKIIKFSAEKFYEYFSLFKGYWQMAYESISLTFRKNKKYYNNKNGFIYYKDKSNNKIYIWEYVLTDIDFKSDEQNIHLNLIYSENNNLTIKQIINDFSSFTDEEKKKCPVCDFKSNQDLPIYETLLPLFKRKLLSYIYQSKKYKNLPTIQV